jgi:hypothetical protein
LFTPQSGGSNHGHGSEVRGQDILARVDPFPAR